MKTAMYHPMTRIINELNHQINNMPRYATQAAERANAAMPKVNIDFNRETVLVPRVDAVEEATAFVLVVELAGVDRKSVV